MHASSEFSFLKSFLKTLPYMLLVISCSVLNIDCQILMQWVKTNFLSCEWHNYWTCFMILKNQNSIKSSCHICNNVKWRVHASYIIQNHPNNRKMWVKLKLQESINYRLFCQLDLNTPWAIWYWQYPYWQNNSAVDYTHGNHKIW